MLYSIALFLHVLGVLGVVSTMALEWAVILGLRRADTAVQARDWLTLLGRSRRPRLDLTSGVAGLRDGSRAWTL